MSENGTAGLLIYRTLPSSTGNTRVNVAHSTAANNTGDGFAVGGLVGANQLNIEYSVARGNVGAGMVVAESDIIRVSNSVSTNNGMGFNNASGTFESRLNNTVAGNTNPNVGVISPLIAQ